MKDNIYDALVEEIERNHKLLEMYKEIPSGTFGAMMIAQDIKRAVEALASGDAVKILEAYKSIRDNE